MKKRYLAMLLAIAIVFAQTVGTGQVVLAAQIAEEEQQEEDAAQEKEGEIEKTEEEKTEGEEIVTDVPENGDEKEDADEEQNEGDVQPEEEGKKEEVVEKKRAAALPEDKQGVGEITILPAEGTELRGSSDWTWLFENETQTFHVDVDGSNTVQWEIGRYTEDSTEAFTEGAPGNPVTWKISEDSKSITVTAKSESSGLFIAASCGDVQHQILVDVKKRKMIPNIWVGREEKIEDFPGEYFISKTNGGDCYVENEDYPNGEELPLTILSIKSEDENIASIGEEGTEWVLQLKKLGQTNIIIKCCLQNDETQTFEKKIPVHVKNEVYSIDLMTGTGSSGMLFDDSLELTANVQGNLWSDSEEEITPIDTKGLRVEWTYEVSSYGNDGQDDSAEVTKKVKLEPNADNSRACRITAGKADHHYEVVVRVKAYKDSEEVASDVIELSVNDFYNLLEPVSINTDILPEEVMEISGVGVYRYQVGKEKELIKDIKISFEYDPEILEITKGDQVISSGDDSKLEAGGNFTVKRLKPEGTELRVKSWVQEEDGQWDYAEIREWWFESCNYNDICFEKDSYEIFASDDPEENETIDMKLNTESIEAEHTVEWTVGLMSEDGVFEQTIDPSNYTASGNVLTLDGNQIKNALKALGQERDYLWVSVLAVVKIGGTEVGSTYSVVDIKTPEYELESVYDRTEVLSTWLYYDKEISCHVENKNYPEGADIAVTLLDIVIEQEERVWKKEEDASGIILNAVGCGEAKVTFKTQSKELGEKDFTVNMNVTDDMYHIYANDGRDYIQLLPGKSHKLKVEVYHSYYDSKIEGIKEEKVNAPFSYLTYDSFDEEVISVKDGTITAKTPLEIPVYSNLQIHLSVPREGRENFECDELLHVEVTNCYYQAVAEKMYVEPGEVVSSVPVKLLRFDTEHENGIEEKGITYSLDDEWNVTFNKDKTGFTVGNDLEDGETFEISVIVEKKVGDEEIREFGQLELEICKHNFVVKSTKQDNCTVEGVKTLECSKCHTAKTETIPKTSHSYGAWQTTREATVFAQGAQVRTCRRCRASETRTLAKLKPFIKLNAKTIPLKVKQSTTAVKVTMEKGDSIASWKSSNKKIATVNSKGKITGKKAGTAKITVTLKSGVKAAIKVKVQKKAVTTSKISVTGKTSKIGKKLTLKKGKSATLAVTVTPITSKEKVTYKSSNKKVAAVTSKGKITAKKPGKAKITVKSGKKKVVITVTVKK